MILPRPVRPILCGLILSTALPAFATDWFVSPQGNDAWSGKLAAPNAEGTDGPWATLAKARDGVRAARKAGDQTAATVFLRGGTHPLPGGLKLNAEDSGTAEAPATWRAYENEKPLLIGGRPISGWKAGENGTFEADVAAQGFKGVAFRQLLFGGSRQPLARYPNFDPQNPYGGGWAYADGEMWPMYADKEGENKHTLLVKAQDLRKWEKPDEVEVFIFPRYNWWNDILRIKEIDVEKRTITTVKDASYAMRANDRFYFQGAKEELDAPGEWYLDKATGKLFFRPPGKEDAAALDGQVFAPTTRDILALEGVSHFILRGLTFECADGSAVVLRKSENCKVVACTVRNVGDFSGTAVSVEGGTNNGVIGCDISFAGRNAVSLSGGDRKKLAATGNYAENCYIHHTGVYYKQGAGVTLDGVGQRVSHNLIHDTPRFAIMFGGNDHVLEFNHLRHIALETEDVGATYCGGRDWISPRGTVIRHNFIHDVLGYGWNGQWVSPYFAWGIYLDDNSGGVDVIGNIVARCGRSLIHGHSARDNRVQNNIFVEGGMRQWEFNGWLTSHRFWTSHVEQMTKGYESVINEPAWADKRGMVIHPQDIPDSEGRVMSGNVFTRNIMFWKNPEAKALNVVNFSSDRNQFDRNLYWNNGNPIRTGQRKAGPVIGGNLAPNPGFETGEVGKMPADWNWQVSTPKANAVVAEDNGQRVLKIDAAFNEEKKRDNYPIVISKEVELKTGVSYRLRAKLRSDHPDAKTTMYVQFYLPPKDGQPGHFWASPSPQAKLTTSRQEYEVAFTVPAKGEKGYHEKMGKFRIRFDWQEKEGALLVDDVVLEETETLDEWQSWNQMGADRRSLVADPKFVDPDKDDFRLAADSPAWALGFQPIPVEKIGPYESPDRATWPIVEAEGAREKPLTPGVKATTPH